MEKEWRLLQKRVAQARQTTNSQEWKMRNLVTGNEAGSIKLQYIWGSLRYSIAMALWCENCVSSFASNHMLNRFTSSEEISMFSRNNRHSPFAPCSYVQFSNAGSFQAVPTLCHIPLFATTSTALTRLKQVAHALTHGYTKCVVVEPGRSQHFTGYLSR